MKKLLPRLNAVGWVVGGVRYIQYPLNKTHLVYTFGHHWYAIKTVGYCIYLTDSINQSNINRESSIFVIFG